MLTATEVESLKQAGHDVSELPEEITRQLFWELFTYGVNGEQVNAIVATMRSMLEAKIKPREVCLSSVPTDLPAVAELLELGQNSQAFRYRIDGDLVQPDEDSHDVRLKWNNTLHAALDFEKMFKTQHSMDETEKVIHFVRGLSIILWEVAGLGKYVEVSPAMAGACKTVRKSISLQMEAAHA